MPIKVQCACGKAFAAKDEIAGKTVKCPGCQKPVKIPGSQAPAAQPKPAAAKQGAAKPAAAPKAAAKAAAASKSEGDLYDELGLQAVAVGTQPCPGCSEPMPIQAIICIKCGYNTRIGRRMETVKVQGEAGPEGHGGVAQSLLDRAAAVIDDDAKEEAKKSTEGMPWWGYLIFLLLLLSLAIWMLFNWGVEKPEDEKKVFLPPSVQRVVV